MPLARIITRTPQHAVGASDYLRSLGYTVETVSPEEFRVTPAELELNLERCGPSEAVERAFTLVESSASAPPKIAAPAIAKPPAPPQKNKVAIAYDITGQPVEFAEEEEEAEARPKTTPAKIVFAHAADWLQRPWSELRQRSAERRSLKLEAEAAREREEIRRQAELASERLRQEVERQREAAELAERRRQKLVAEERAQREQAKVAALHEATIAMEPEVAPEQPPSEILPPEIEPVVAAEVASDNLSVLARAGEPAPEAEPAPVAEVVRPQVPLRVPERPRLILPRRRRAPIAISRAAVATACGLSLLVLMSFVAYANRRPASPLPPSALRDVKQEVPFGAASITPQPAPAPRTPASKHSAAVRPASRKPSAGQSGVRPPSRDNAQDAVVVRHLQPAQPQPSTAKLKRHSDLD